MSNMYVIPYYPIGSVLEFDRAIDMNSIYGGTWELYGAGRMTVCINASDASFNTPNETGGSKTHTQSESEIAKHRHLFNIDMGGVKSNVYMGSYVHEVTPTPTKNPGFGTSIASNKFVYGERTNSIYVDTKGESVPMNIMNPYIVVYRYHKIAD